MRIDLWGLAPDVEPRRHFPCEQNWWNPLWSYCCQVGVGVIPEDVAIGGYQSCGLALEEEQSLALAELLIAEIESGRTAEHETQHNNYRESLTKEKCSVCEGTGIRTDEIGVEKGYPETKLTGGKQVSLGRIYGWCDVCDGDGEIDSVEYSLMFSVEQVELFVDFLQESGGFTIN